MRGRRPVDWEEELKKTKRIQKKGFFMSSISFVVALGVIGAAKLHNPDIAIGKVVLPVFFMFIILIALISILRRRKK